VHEDSAGSAYSLNVHVSLASLALRPPRNQAWLGVVHEFQINGYGVSALGLMADTDDEAVYGDATLCLPCPSCGGCMHIIETFEAGCQPHHRPTAAIRIDIMSARSASRNRIPRFGHARRLPAGPPLTPQRRSPRHASQNRPLSVWARSPIPTLRRHLGSPPADHLLDGRVRFRAVDASVAAIGLDEADNRAEIERRQLWTLAPASFPIASSWRIMRS
jgi:hypothetical protein